jgi:DNA excision repair protein ERCC-2
LVYYIKEHTFVEEFRKLEILMSNEVRISVRTLVEYVFSSGSIDSRFRSQNSLAEGTRIHQKIQKNYGETDKKELYLSVRIPFEDLTFMIDGRCDGLLVQEDGMTVDEIKSFSQPLQQIEEDGYPVHWAQAKMYAYIYASENNLENIGVQLTYVHVETEEKRVIKKLFTNYELHTFVSNIIKAYAPYAKQQFQHALKRNQSIKDLSFPFQTYREGQRKLASAVYQTILEEKNLFVKAPTGIGKTMSTLFPSVKAIGEGHLKKIFYLTAKTITRTTAEDSFARMRTCGLHLSTTTLTAKDKICFKKEPICQPDYCEFANGYYDRINEGMLDILINETNMTRETIETYARKHSICPFEFSIDLAYAVDAVICDYNYIFDPRVSLKRQFDGVKKSTILLIDEAHNLVDRGREMYSASLNKESFLQIKNHFKGEKNEVYHSASKINAWFISLKKRYAEQAEFVMNSLEEELIQLLIQFVEALGQILVQQNNSNPTLADGYFMVQKFLKISELLDDHYVIYGEKNRNNVIIKLFCMDPAKLLNQMGKGYRSKVFFSATLSPLPYYQEILGGKEEDYLISIPSPFSKEQVDIYIQPISTRYSDRDRSKAAIVAMLHSLMNSRPGNYLIFFPSYQYLLSVYEEFKLSDEDTRTLVQSTGMKEEEREEFLAAFKPNRTKPLLGFAVLGGIFSEGVDLVGDCLNGVVIIGVGLPQLCFERNLIKEHFQAKNNNGYEFAYVYPGMNKVLQAGGRLIRSENDYGTIVLVDDRFLKKQYQRLLPIEWSHYTII